MIAGPHSATTSRGPIWFGLFGGAIAWTIHLMFAYVTAEFGCVSGLAERDYLGLSIVAWIEFALTAVTTLLAGAATAVAYGVYRRLQSENQSGTQSAERYALRAGVLTSGIFTFVIVFESIPILYYLQNC